MFIHWSAEFVMPSLISFGKLCEERVILYFQLS